MVVDEVSGTRDSGGTGLQPAVGIWQFLVCRENFISVISLGKAQQVRGQ